MYESDNKIQIPVTFDTAPIVIRHLEELGFKPRYTLQTYLEARYITVRLDQDLFGYDEVNTSILLAPSDLQHIKDKEELIAWYKVVTDELMKATADAYVSPSPDLVDFSKPRNASQIADAALTHIKDRASTYDSPEGERSALKTARAFQAITGKHLTEAEVFLILQILKDVRQWQKHDYHQDSAEDAIAYAALKAEALESEVRT